MTARSPAQWFCLIAGALLVVRGTVGLALDPVFDLPGEGWHQLFHLGSGVALLACSRAPAPALAFAGGFALVYGVIAIAGIVDGNDVAGVIPIQMSDNRTHAVLTIAALGAALTSVYVARPARRASV